MTMQKDSFHLGSSIGTAESLSNLRKKAEAATPGPWEAITDCPGECCWLIGRPETDEAPAKGVTWPETSREDAAYIAAANPSVVLRLLDALELVRDCSSQEWQQPDGKRMAATDNQGRRFWFITEDVIQAVRDALSDSPPSGA